MQIVPGKAPPGLTPGNLRAFATIEEGQIPVDPYEKTGEPAVRKWQHPARPQEYGVDHLGLAGTAVAAIAQA